MIDNKVVKEISIIFENCEMYTIPCNYIETLSINNLKYGLSLNINGRGFSNDNEMHSNISCNNAYILINKEGMKVKTSFPENDIELKDRVQRGLGTDISNFNILFDDDSELYISMPWEDMDDEYHNKRCFVKQSEDLLLIEFKEEEFTEEYMNEIGEYFEDYDLQEDIPFKEEVPNYVLAALSLIEKRLDTYMFNLTQKEYDSPFYNTGERYIGDNFEVISYDWVDDQKYNFKWKDYKILWYKHIGRDTWANRTMSPEECSIMLNECLEEISQKEENTIDL